MSESCRMCGEILSHATCSHCGSQYSICDGCDHLEPGRRLPERYRYVALPDPNKPGKTLYYRLSDGKLLDDAEVRLLEEATDE